MLAPVSIEGHARNRSHIDERSIFLVVIKNARRAIAGHIDIGPAIVVVVERRNAETVVPVSFFNPARFAYVRELSAAEIVIENVGRKFEPARAAHHRCPLPYAPRALPRLGRRPDIEEHIIGDEKIEFAIAVIVDKGATGAPCLAVARDSRSARNFLKSTVAFVVVETALAVIRYVKIVEAVIVIVSHARSLSPAGEGEAGSLSDIGESSVVVIVKQVAGRFRCFSLCLVQRGAVHKKYVRPAVIIIIKNCHATARGFNNVLLIIDSAVYVFHTKSCLGSYIFEPDRTGMSVPGEIRRGRRLCRRGSRPLGLRRTQCKAKAEDEARATTERFPPPTHKRIVSRTGRCKRLTLVIRIERCKVSFCSFRYF